GAGDQDVGNRFDVLPVVAGVSQAHAEALPAFDRHRDATAAHGGLDGLIDVGDVDTVARQFLAVDVDFEVAFAHGLVGDDVGGAGNGAELGCDLVGNVLHFRDGFGYGGGRRGR